MRFRQVNLDFHTNENIDNIGKNFSKEQFQRCLKMGHINAITLFAKCHHGWAYHPSDANEIHPNLEFDLLGAEIEAAREIGVETTIYFSLCNDEKMAVKKSEWLHKRYNAGDPDFSLAAYHALCCNTEYIDYFCSQLYETLSKYDADGVFVDIAEPIPCVCETCVKQLISEGKDPESEADVWELGHRVFKNYAKRIRETIDSVKPGLPLFFNGGHISRGKRDIEDVNTHFEIESLPTGGWGYDNFPISASYARTLGKEYLGMTGKFHLHWGEFGGYKHPNALRYEISLFAANGAKFSIGDQMLPDGTLDDETYRIIGEVYSEAEKKEPWLENAKNIADIGVLGVEAIGNYYTTLDPWRDNLSDFGAVRVLNEGHYLYNFIDAEEDFSRYKLIILPDKIELDDFLEEKLKSAVEKGTKILATGKSGLKNGKFALDFGCEFIGENDKQPSYIRPNFKLKTYGDAAFVIYSTGYEIELKGGTSLAERENPYFNRTAKCFCSHMHTPSDKRPAGCGISQGNDGIYIAWELFNEYSETGSLVSKEIICAVIDRLMDKTVETNLMQQGIMTLTEQDDRKIVHLIYAAAVKRGNVEVIEDIPPILNIEVKVKAGFKPKRVYLAPQNKEIDFVFKDGYTEFTVDYFECHQMIVVER